MAYYFMQFPNQFSSNLHTKYQEYKYFTYIKRNMYHVSFILYYVLQMPPKIHSKAN